MWNREGNTKRRKLLFYHDMQDPYSAHIILVCRLIALLLKALWCLLIVLT
jgi:hypothetical protein